MDKYFYDKKNFDNINQVINQTVHKKTGRQVDPKHAKLVYKMMNYVFENTEKPVGMKKKQYLSVLNHQVLQVALPRIEQLTVNQTEKAVVDRAPPANAPTSSGMIPPPTVNSETREEFNAGQRFEQMQAERGMGAPPQAAMMSNGGMSNGGMGNREREQLEGITDSAMSQEESEKKYNDMLASRQQGIAMAVTAGAGQNLEQRNDSMANFENSNRQLNGGVEEYSERIEERGEGEKIGNLDSQFQPILSSGGQHPALNQASGLANLISQDVDTLLAQRLDENIIVKDNGGLQGVSQPPSGGVTGGVTGGITGSGIEPVIEKMVGNNIGEMVDIDRNIAERQDMNAFKQQVVVPPIPQEKYTKREYYINVDSRDRDLEVYPDVNKFQIKFAPSSDSQELFKYRDTNGNVLYETRKGFVGDGHGASLPEVYDNIYSIECVSATIPYDITYVCGICPYRYNSYQIDQNKIVPPAAEGQFTSWPYGPNYTPATSGSLVDATIGVATSVLDEPYLLLNVDELEGNNPYIGTNKATTNTFAKLLHDGYFGVLTSFIQLKPDYGTKKIYKPQALGKLDKMTLNLVKHNGKHYNFGNDKLYVKCFQPVSGEGNECKTRVVIVPPDDECGDCEQSHGHCLRPGNLIYFYDTLDCVNNEVLFYKTVQPVVEGVPLGTGESEIDGVSASGELKISGTVRDDARGINFAAFLEVGDYLLIQQVGGSAKYTVRINSFSVGSNGASIMHTEIPDGWIDGLAINKFGFYRKNMKGITNEGKNTFNYVEGKRVCGTESDDFDDCDGNEVSANTGFIINYRYANLPTRLKSKDLTFSDGSGRSEVFFIKKRMQVSYTFRVTVLEQDVGKVHSSMI